MTSFTHNRGTNPVTEIRMVWTVCILCLLRFSVTSIDLNGHHFVILLQVSNVKMCRYVSASSIGLLPTQALNAYIGSTLRSMEDVMADHSSSYLVLVAQVLISIALMVYVIRRARTELNKTCEESELEIQVNGDIVVVRPKLLPLTTESSFDRL